ncbi:DUF3016 domain-containing protein [Paraglaciecola aestuariivivens]
MKHFYLAILICALALYSLSSLAKAEIEVIWQQPENFTDVKHASSSSERFEEKTFNTLGNFFAKLAAKLPKDQKLIITVKDLDLAGRVTSASYAGFGRSGSDVRVINRVNMPRIDFSYQLLDNQGVVLKEAEINLKDPNFKHRFNPFRESSKLRYEKNMLRLWFKQELPTLLAKN